jgi:2-methylisocitrate lyase-like PEP mutase family enzyme
MPDDAIIAARRDTFRRLHAAGCFALPNPWDVGTARYLQHLGFAALATTSAGAAFTLGFPDSDRVLARDVMLAHIRALVDATDVPVNADYGSAYARDAEGVADSVRLCVATGVAGLSIEDSTGDDGAPLYDIERAADRVRASRDAAGPDVVLTARAENFIAGRPDLDDAVRRLVAYAAAGADCLYAPGLTTRAQIGAVVRAVAPKPVNVLMSASTGITMADLAALGVRRVSVGSGLARAAWGAFIRAARELADAGRFDAFADAVPHGTLNAFFTDDLARRRRRHER